MREVDENTQRDVMKKITKSLATENVAKDINGYPKAPPSFRVWGGGTVDPEDINKVIDNFEKFNLAYPITQLRPMASLKA